MKALREKRIFFVSFTSTFNNTTSNPQLICSQYRLYDAWRSIAFILPIYIACRCSHSFFCRNLQKYFKRIFIHHLPFNLFFLFSLRSRSIKLIYNVKVWHYLLQNAIYPAGLSFPVHIRFLQNIQNKKNPSNLFCYSNHIFWSPEFILFKKHCFIGPKIYL